MDPAAANHVNRLERTSPNELATELPLLFEKILDPDQEPKLTYSYVVSTRHDLHLSVPRFKSARPPSPLSEEFSPAKGREWKTQSP